MSVTSGAVSAGKIVVTSDSLQLGQLLDVEAANPSHDDVVTYKDSSVDPAYATSAWYSGPLLLENLGDVISSPSPSHNELLAYNDSTQDNAYATGWVNKNISALFTGLSTTIAGIVSASDAVQKGVGGDLALSDMIMMSDTAAASGPTNLSVGSADDNNELYKRELADSGFVFVQTLSAGEIANLSYTTGTILRSTKGIYGLTGPFPTPLGISGMSFKSTRFATAVASTAVIVASLGMEVTVTLFEADGTTVADGPTLVAENAVASLACNSTGEFLLGSTGSVVGVVNGGGTELRVLAPMSSELICWNAACSVSCSDGTAAVTWTRRNATSGTTSVTSGVSTGLNAGSDTGFAGDGCVILRADKPISCYTGSDGAGAQSIPGWPLDRLAQKFSFPSHVGNDADYAVSSVAVGSPYEGSVDVYDNTGALLDTFALVRSVSPATTAATQLEPAAERWKPSDVSAATVLDGGYVVSNVPCICVANFSGSSVWTSDSGNELTLAGTTPGDVRADVKKDANGLLRRRTIDGAGAVTWEVC